MKRKEVLSMNEEEKSAKLTELRKELMKNRAQIAAGTVPKSPGQIKQIRKAIARILTTRRKKEKA